MLTLQLHIDHVWQDAALLHIADPSAGIGGSSRLDYELAYVMAQAGAGLAKDAFPIDRRALSIRFPVNFEGHALPHWPAFLLDMMPQGRMRARLAGDMGFANSDAAEVELPLLLRAGSNPVGNLRIREAWQAERDRIALDIARNGPCPGLTDRDILDGSDTLHGVMDRFSMVASGSSGLQGEWPKAMLTQARDGLWYPDSLLQDEEARDHAIVKFARGHERSDLLILASEAPYLEIARAFGLRVGRALRFNGRSLMIPRFDRRVTGNGLERFGQESVLSAMGIAAFGPGVAHEDVLATLCAAATDPVELIVEYLLRDVLNQAMGNPDNHGRNTALQKSPDGWVGLAPLYDFAPMRLDPRVIARASRWACMGSADAWPDWARICRAAAGSWTEAEKLAAILAQKADFLDALPGLAREHGVETEVMDRAFGRHAEIAAALRSLKG